MPYQDGTYLPCCLPGFVQWRSKKKSLSQSKDEVPATTKSPDDQETSQPAARQTREIKRPSALKSTRKIPKIEQLLTDQKHRPEPEDTREDLETYGEKEFTEDELKAAWKEFADRQKKAGKNSAFTVLDQPIRLKDNYTIILPLSNAVKINILDKFRSDLITHLKSTLDNRHITLETELLKEEVSYRPYTNKEKFDYLIEKKPVLQQLKDRLGLDPDF